MTTRTQAGGTAFQTSFEFHDDANNKKKRGEEAGGGFALSDHHTFHTALQYRTEDHIPALRRMAGGLECVIYFESHEHHCVRGIIYRRILFMLFFKTVTLKDYKNGRAEHSHTHHLPELYSPSFKNIRLVVDG